MYFGKHIFMCNWFLRPDLALQWLFKIKNIKNADTTSIFHIKLKRCKDIYSTVQAEIIEIENLYSADLKKVLGAYPGIIDIFVNVYDVEAWHMPLH